MTCPPPRRSGHGMRYVENWAMGAAIIIALAYGLAESAARIGLCFKACPVSAEFPWGLVVIQSTLALPKMLGRATAGRVWDAVANRVAGKTNTP